MVFSRGLWDVGTVSTGTVNIRFCIRDILKKSLEQIHVNVKLVLVLEALSRTGAKRTPKLSASRTINGYIFRNIQL